MDEGAVRDTVRLHWALAAAGLADLVWGHGALRSPAGDGIYLKVSGWAFEEVNTEKVLKVSWAGELLEGSGGVHLEVPIHTAIMGARDDVNCVVHSHSPAVNAFASLRIPLRAVSHDGVFFAEDLPRFDKTGDLIRTPELGKELAQTLGEAPALIMPQHGFVTVGKDPAEAAMMATLLARACQTYLVAAAGGEVQMWSDPAEVRAKRQIAFRPYASGYRYLVRRGKALHDQLSVDDFSDL
jgi:ribulose-5-phosphate 4-epimerase/fuculose-1-phosphate aldolase